MQETVAGRMTAGAVTVDEQADLESLAAAIGRARLGVVAVVDEFGRLLGGIERDDHPDLFACGATRVAGTPRQRRRRERRALATARDLMSPAATVLGHAPAPYALRVFANAGTDLVFVIDGLGCVVGTVTIEQCRPVPAGSRSSRPGLRPGASEPAPASAPAR